MKVWVINSRKSSWTDHVARLEEDGSAFKRPLGRPRHRCENNIRMELEEVGINTGNWVHSAQDRDYWRALVIRH